MVFKHFLLKIDSSLKTQRLQIYRNPKTVLRVMQKCNLLSVVRRKNFIIAVSTCTDTQIFWTENLMPKGRIKSGLQIYPTLKLLKAFCIYQLSETCIIIVLLHIKWIKNKVLNRFSMRLKPQRGKKKSLRSCSSAVTKGFSTHPTHTSI